MSPASPHGDSSDRLHRALEIAAREDAHLLAVRERLFGAPPRITAEWITQVLAAPEGIDRLESFGAKFGRMQDMVIGRLLPRLLTASGERPGTAIDNLNRAEQLGLLTAVDDWLAVRWLRNRLVHEYIDDPSEMVKALARAYCFTDTLHEAYQAIAAYAAEHLGVRLDGAGH